jgi:hypothetical protein
MARHDITEDHTYSSACGKWRLCISLHPSSSSCIHQHHHHPPHPASHHHRPPPPPPSDHHTTRSNGGDVKGATRTGTGTNSTPGHYGKVESSSRFCLFARCILPGCFWSRRLFSPRCRFYPFDDSGISYAGKTLIIKETQNQSTEGEDGGTGLNVWDGSLLL